MVLEWIESAEWRRQARKSIKESGDKDLTLRTAHRWASETASAVQLEPDGSISKGQDTDMTEERLRMLDMAWGMLYTRNDSTLLEALGIFPSEQDESQ